MLLTIGGERVNIKLNTSKPIKIVEIKTGEFL
jgi:hypothetical protein